MPTNTMKCCKEKAVLIAVYEEKPRKKRVKTSNKDNIKHHHHHHHHHHHIHLHQSKNGEGNNRRAGLLSYSQHLRESAKLSGPSNPPQHPKSLVASTKDEQTMAPVLPVPKKKKLKKKSSFLNLDKLFKCFAISYTKRRVKQKKAKVTSPRPAKKANAIMKTFNARTQKGARRFWLKLMATIQKYR